MPNSIKLNFQKTENILNTFSTFKRQNEKDNLLFDERLNEISNLNQVLFEINHQIAEDQIITFKFETLRGRVTNNLKKHSIIFAYFKIILDFILHRFLAKTFLFYKVIDFITNNKTVVLSKAEGLGRLAYCGFEIVDEFNEENLLYVKVKKGFSKSFNNKEPRYGFIIKMPRIGKNGKRINVYKIRTMHPYAEFIHGYLLKANGYNEKGKPANDFRITAWGKYLRKYWIDEIPQLINVLRGEMKLIGIRPVSERYLIDIPEEIRLRRLKFKPGCIPPYLGFYVGTTKENVIAAEEIYMNQFEKNPIKTDFIVFTRALFNIFIKKQRSA